MNPFLIFLVELLIVFFTSRFIFKAFFAIFYVLTKHVKSAITILAFIFFVGVVIHELSHLLVAELLQVKTRGMELVPEIQDGQLKMGSVSVEKTDFLRQFLIGVAPLVVGCTVIVASLLLLAQFFTLESVIASPMSFLVAIGISFLLFVISNTMFSSRKDMEGAVELLIIVVILEIGLFVLQVPVNQFIFSFTQNLALQQIMWRVSLLFAIPTGINIVAVFLSFLFLKKKRLILK